MTAITLSPLDASEAAGITFSLVDAEFGEMGVVIYGLRSHASSAVARHMEAGLGLVPRTQAAVDVMAEVLS